jgi:fumarate reductase subunit D
MRRSNEPFLWSLFSAGGLVTALLTPVLILVSGLLVPTHHVGYGKLHDIFTNPVGRLAVFGLAFLTFFHWAHRFRHVLIDVGLAAFGLPIALACYLLALAASAWAGVVAFT